MNRYPALILALLMALLCVLPVSLAEETVTAETAATEATEAPAAEDQVLATLANGTEIMQSEVDAIANQVISYYANYGYDMSSEDTLPIVRQMAMETYLQENFYKDSLVTLGLDQLTEEDMAAIEKNVDEVYEGLIDQVYTYYGLEPAEDATEEEKATARANAIATLDSMGYTYDYIVLNETESYNYDKVTRALTADLSVSEEDLLATYNAHVEEDKAAYAASMSRPNPTMVMSPSSCRKASVALPTFSSKWTVNCSAPIRICRAAMRNMQSPLTLHRPRLMPKPLQAKNLLSPKSL